MHAIYISTHKNIQTTWWTTLAYLMHYLHEYDFANWLPQGFAQYHTQVLHLTGYPWDSVHQVSSACSRCQHQWSQWSLHAKRARPPPVQRKTPGTWGPARSKAGWHSMLRSWQYMTWFSMKFEIPYVQKFYTYIYIYPPRQHVHRYGVSTCVEVIYNWMGPLGSPESSSQMQQGCISR